MVKEGKVSASIFDRLAQTDTYASKRLKERKVIEKTSSAGRPLYTIDVSYDEVKHKKEVSPRGVVDANYAISPNSSFSTTGSTRSTASSSSYSRPRAKASPTKVNKSSGGASVSSRGSRRSTNTNTSTTTTTPGSSVFDRLAYTGTKTSLMKHKKSDLYVPYKERPKEESLLREFEGNTNVMGNNGNRDVEERRKKHVYQPFAAKKSILNPDVKWCP